MEDGKKVDNLNPTKLDEVTEPVKTVEITTSNNTLSKVVNELTTNAAFLSNIDDSIKKILLDGKVDYKDIPEIVFLIMDSYNHINLNISKNDLTEFVKLIFEFIVNKYNLFSKEDMLKVEPMIISSVKLVLLIPQINRSNYTNFFKCC